MADPATVRNSKMSGIMKTSILFLVVIINIASSLPFERKEATETDNKFSGVEVKNFLTRSPNRRENVEATLESRFDGLEHDRVRRHEEFDNPHNFHRENWHHNHGPPNGHLPPRGDLYGYENPPFGHIPGPHHKFGDPNFMPFHPHGDFHPQPWDLPPHWVNNDKPPNWSNDVIPDTEKPTKPNKKNQDDNVTDVISENGQTTEKTTKYPDIDIRLGTRK